MQISPVRSFNSKGLNFKGFNSANALSAKINGKNVFVSVNSKGINKLDTVLSDAIFMLRNFEVANSSVMSSSIDARNFRKEAQEKYEQLLEAYKKGNEVSKDGRITRKISKGAKGCSIMREYSSEGKLLSHCRFEYGKPAEYYESPTMGTRGTRWKKAICYDEKGNISAYQTGYFESFDGSTSAERTMVFYKDSYVDCTINTKSLPNGDKLIYSENITYTNNGPERFQRIYGKNLPGKAQSDMEVIYRDGMPEIFSLTEKDGSREILFRNAKPAKFAYKQKNCNGCPTEITLRLPSSSVQSTIETLEDEREKFKNYYNGNSWGVNFDFIV